MKIIRLFPRRTNATPDDENVRVNCQPGFFDECDEVHISVAFTWDLPKAEKLEKMWKHVANCKIGGPALGQRGEQFTPGLYLKPGYTITSRGCNNHCWFCSVPKREGAIREYQIHDGWNILDDNLLQCSESHIDKVFSMLKRQKRKPEFTGGLEHKFITPIIAKKLKALKPAQIFLAYDEEQEFKDVSAASEILHEAGFSKTSHSIRAYVLIGYPKDTQAQAERRLKQMMGIGVVPMAMLWKNDDGKSSAGWRNFQRQWARPAIICGARITDDENESEVV
jgi:hypothetical protein